VLESFRYVRRFRVPFADIDMLRHVNNAAYIRWAEQIRSEYFSEILGEDITSERGMIMAHLTIAYERPVVYRENVAIGCRISRFGTKSFDFAYEIWSEDHGIRVATLTSAMVAMNYTLNRSIPVPDQWRAKVRAFEERGK
jgi:acyl-CoA thioester hydrolase